MRQWAKILPYFFIEWYAKRYCEAITLHQYNAVVVSPFKDMFIKMGSLKDKW